MSGRIIGSIYEIANELGSGGGGVVYKAKHLRLNHEVVIKVDKHKLSGSSELYAREVNVLKGLKNDFIPQVYDFFEEDGMVCTVMEFVRGESLDKPLKRGEVFSQAQVIKWAKQILNALVYLHSPTHGEPPKGYIHGDIKPANIMRLPDNNICLIDFNVSLALGEYNFIGRSAGYSSPEHYGYDYRRSANTQRVDINGTTEIVGYEETSINGDVSKNSSTFPIKRILPDERSDIYMLGATMYHLISGIRPDTDAKKVTPLRSDKYSYPMIKIISKAMEPDPDLRFQSAKEMLDALNNIKRDDPRTRKFKRQNRITAALCAVLSVCGLFTAFVGSKQLRNTEAVLKNAEYSAAALEQGDRKAAIRYALEALPEEDLFTPSLPQGRLAITDALGVYDLSDTFYLADIIRLDGYAIDAKLSDDGRILAVSELGKLHIYSTENVTAMYTLDTIRSVQAEFEFIDNDNIVYAGADGITCFDLSSGTAEWVGEKCTGIAVSGDKTLIAAIYKDNEDIFLYDPANGEYVVGTTNGRKQMIPKNDELMAVSGNLFELDEHGSRLMISFDDGEVILYDLQSGDELTAFDDADYSCFYGGFFENYAAFSAYDGKETYVGIIDTKRLDYAVDADINGNLSISTDKNGIYINQRNSLVRFDTRSAEQIPVINTNIDIESYSVGDNYTIAVTENSVELWDKAANKVNVFQVEGKNNICCISDTAAAAGSTTSSSVRVIKYQDSRNTIMTYDNSYHHIESRLDESSGNVVQFSTIGFRVLDANGSIISEHEFDSPTDVYDSQFIRNNDGAFLEITYTDGSIENYSSIDGMLVSVSSKQINADIVDEEFFTADYRFYQPVNGKARVYDKKGNELFTFDSEDALVYVYECGEYIVAHFKEAHNYSYGLLLDAECNEIAHLPYLADVVGDKFIFDYPTGKICCSYIYSLDELIEMGREIIE